MGFGGLSRNCFGGCNMMSSLMLIRGTGLGFTLSHFPVLGGGVGFFHWFINNSINCPLVSLLRSFFCWFINDLINCPLVSFLRSFFSISILYGFVFKPFLGRVPSYSYPYYMVLSLSLFWAKSFYNHYCSYPYI